MTQKLILIILIYIPIISITGYMNQFIFTSGKGTRSYISLTFIIMTQNLIHIIYIPIISITGYMNQLPTPTVN